MYNDCILGEKKEGSNITIECVHGGHIGGARQWNDFPLGN